MPHVGSVPHVGSAPQVGSVPHEGSTPQLLSCVIVCKVHDAASRLLALLHKMLRYHK